MMGEYDAGYENYIDSLIREIEKLQDENDKLSEQVSSLVGRSFRTADKISCIEADNAKLREFARDMWCMTTFCHGTSDAEIADMYRRMRELGFMENYGEEVDA